MNAFEKGYVVVTDFVEANTGKDVSDALQKLVLDNPNRTIYFPDGEYILSKPLCTPANPVHSVMLELSNYAVLKASEDWSEEEAVVRLGAAEPWNNISTNGSNYGIRGGIIDGSGVANGVSIDSGRETRIEGVSIKHTFVGIHIKHGANTNSSDADVINVNIVGNGKPGSVGVLVIGSDNSFTNMRIASVQTGVLIARGGGNLLRNVHPLYIFEKELEGLFGESVGFDVRSGCHWFDICYSDQFATGFKLGKWATSNFNNCYCYWYTSKGDKQIGFEVEGQLRSVIRACRIDLREDCKNKSYMTVEKPDGIGVVENPVLRCSRSDTKDYLDHLQGSVIDLDNFVE